MRSATSLAAACAAALVLSACGDETSLTESGPLKAPAGGAPALALAAAPNSWTSLAPMPTSRYYHSVGVKNNAAGQPILYVFGGFDAKWDEYADRPVHLRTIELYNLATDTWTTRAGSVFAVARVNGVGRIGGKFYLPGGGTETGDGFETLRWLIVYDPTRDTWTRKADMPRPSSGGVSGVIDRKLYVLTGEEDAIEGCPDCGPSVATRRLFRYDPASDTWASRLRCPHFHRVGAAGVIDGKLYVAGGSEPGGVVSGKLDIYDPVTNT